MPVVVAKRREEAAHVALAAAAVTPDVFLLDDGFQHLRVARNANLLIVNPEKPFWEDAPIPSGRLREASTAATRADGFLIVGANTDATLRLHNRFPEHPQFELTRQTPYCWPLGQEIPRAWPTNENLPSERFRLPLRVWGYRLQTSSPETLVSWLKELTGLSSLPDAS